MAPIHSIWARIPHLIAQATRHVVSAVRHLVHPEPPAPAEPKKRRRQHVPDVLRGDEPDRLIAAATNDRDRLAFRIARYAGLRVAEICALRVESIHMGDGILSVVNGKGGKDRNVPIHAALAPELEAWTAGRTAGWLFNSPKYPGTHISTRTIQTAITDAAANAGMDRHIHMHLWRHSAATNLLRACHDLRVVQTFLGHSSVATTQIYAHVDQADVQAAVALL